MLRLTLPAEDHLPLHGLAASRAWETEALSASAPQALMALAGLATAKLALAIAPHARHITLLCGPGNNGGDGLVAARHLQAAGRQITLLHCPGKRGTPPDAAWALQQAQAAGLQPRSSDWPTSLAPCDLVIDALLGLAARQPAQGHIAEAIRLCNAAQDLAPVLAVDLPSGLDGQTGCSGQGPAVRADHTLSLLTLKPGLFTAQGRALAGRIWWDRLTRPCPTAPDAWLLGAQALADWQALAGTRRNHATHKGSFGDVLVLGGAPGMRGAAQLAALAALAAGAGRVHVCSLESSDENPPPLARPELMHWPEAQLNDPLPWQGHTVVAGCGGGLLMARVLGRVLVQARRLVLDADGLNAVAADRPLRALLRARQAQGRPSVLTPHPLEAARLLGSSSAAVQADRLGAAQALAQDLRCTVLLKGSGSVIASPGQPPAINGSGNSRLATAGTGDVLAGWAGGLWAQLGRLDGAGQSGGGTQPADDSATSHQLACAAAYWHGAAAQLDADRAGPLRASDLVERMHACAPPAPHRGLTG